ncbi:hypothetical protein chiPu_0022379, partial [Chiloscyllium punctatum]|nr:hypothetical protein [Chiloscyllium punctatum]
NNQATACLICLMTSQDSFDSLQCTNWCPVNGRLCDADGKKIIDHGTMCTSPVRQQQNCNGAFASLLACSQIAVD